MKNDQIMVRMKDCYESRSRTYLTRRTPVIMRLDGKAFHTYTKGLNKPFDTGLIEDMQNTAIYLCSQIQGAKCAYVQSDEISILLTDYDNLNTDAWFDYQVQKMVSISASLATGIFNQLRFIRQLSKEDVFYNSIDTCSKNVNYIINTDRLANFDSRVFNIPKEEVANYFLARQNDAVKNSISMLAQSLYSHKELDRKHSGDLQEMCFQKGHNWNDLPFEQKRGGFIVKNTYINNRLGEILESEGTTQYKLIGVDLPNFSIFPDLEKTDVVRSKWEVVETPMKFSGKDFHKYL